ncbi:MAG: hypothetical protein JXO22_01605 [Phycisphaerae bacterium]|nr:hypothetical protein [Phycisphaerae bacterium]
MSVTPDEIDTNKSTGQRRWAWALIAIGLGCSIGMAAFSDGTHHDDDLTHLQIARWSCQWPAYLLDDWGRPGFTVLYALPAQFGYFPARVFSGLLTAVTAWLAYDIARRQGVPHAALVPALLWLQPLTFTLSYTWLTETTLALYLTLGMWLLLRRHYTLSAFFISLCMVTRHEGALFVGLWGLLYLYQRRPVREWLLLAWAPLLHNLLSWVFLRQVPFVARFLNPTPTAEYGDGGWLWMWMQWSLAASLGVLLLTLIGVPSYLRRRRTRFWFTCGLAFFLAQTVIFRFGLFASGGYPRFLVAIGPVVAILAADGVARLAAIIRASEIRANVANLPAAALVGCGLLWLGAEFGLEDEAREFIGLVRLGLFSVMWGLFACVVACQSPSQRIRRGGIRALLVGLLALAMVQDLVGVFSPRPYNWCSPLALVEVQRAHHDAVAWIDGQPGSAGRRRYSANVWFNEFAGNTVPPHQAFAKDKIDTLEPGDFFVWDSKYAATPSHGVALETLRGRGDYVELTQSRQRDEHGVPFWVIFRKCAAASLPTSAPSEPTP